MKQSNATMRFLTAFRSKLLLLLKDHKTPEMKDFMQKEVQKLG